MVNRILRGLLGCAVLLISINGLSQRYLSDLDSSLFIKDTIRPLLERFGNLRFTGYIQPQFQVAQKNGSKSYNGGDFSEFSKSRFMLRRARLKVDYFLLTKDGYAKALFTFQFDATERGVGLRDMFVKLYEPKKHNFSLTMGMFARPFGFEVNLSSAYRETPERGRMSQILMPSERDLGAMISYEPLRTNANSKFIKVDVGFFNGQGLSGSADFDGYKDLNSRITIKPIPWRKFEFSGGVSLFRGGWRQATKYVYRVGANNSGDKIFAVDSVDANIGKIAPRHYYGADGQVKFRHGWGETEWRAEYWLGKQPGTATTTANPGALPVLPTYIRRFDGIFLLFLQHIVNNKNQLLVKYDWYDPNTQVKGKDIGKPGTNFTVPDIKYTTLGLGFVRYLNANLKIILYYDIVKNESTALGGYTADLKDNIASCRIQFRF
ncbi:MAG: porin [Chitinophagaceae bacterium]